MFYFHIHDIPPIYSAQKNVRKFFVDNFGCVHAYSNLTADLYWDPIYIECDFECCNAPLERPVRILGVNSSSSNTYKQTVKYLTHLCI